MSCQLWEALNNELYAAVEESTYHVVRVLVLGVEEAVRGHHVVHDVRFADLLGTKLLRCRKVTTVIVAEVVVRDDRGGLDAGTHLPNE